MLSKEQVLEIISYCDTHGVQRKDRLRELRIKEWNFYKSRRQYLRQEKKNPGTEGSFIQLGGEGPLVPATVTEMEPVAPHTGAWMETGIWDAFWVML